MQLHTGRDELFLSTVRMIVDGSVATACLFDIANEPSGVSGTYVVTNRHVVEGGKSGQLFFLRAEDHMPVLENPFTFEMDAEFASLWYLHPDPKIDIAVAPFAHFAEEALKRGIEIGNVWITRKLALDESIFITDPLEHPAMRMFPGAIEEIEEILFAGYPEGFFDRQHHLPVVRRG